MRVRIAIIGGGPSGLLLARKLSLVGIDCAVLERRSRSYVLGRIRAGVLEQGTAEQLRTAGVGARMDSEGLEHAGCRISDTDRTVPVNFRHLTGKSVMVYGQTEITRDLYDSLDSAGVFVRHGAEVRGISGISGDKVRITWSEAGSERDMVCDYVAGCDGFYGPCRSTIPERARTEFHRSYPFGWLGILSRTPPACDELIYARGPRGFALASMRSPSLSRYYLQVPAGEDPRGWSDERFWGELRRRLPEKAADRLVTGPSIEKSVAPLRSFVNEPMSMGRLFLCGDAAHIVPPTGAKGLNLAASDVHYLFEALREAIDEDSRAGLRAYSSRALSRVWRSMRFSWWMTNLLHKFPDRAPFDGRMQDAEFDYLQDSETAQRALAENYTGLAY